MSMSVETSRLSENQYHILHSIQWENTPEQRIQKIGHEGSISQQHLKQTHGPYVNKTTTGFFEKYAEYYNCRQSTT